MAQVEKYKWMNEHAHISRGKTPDPHNSRARQPHTKSKHGCKNCKLRRIKCDEMRPSCGQCRDRLLGSIQCDFDSLQNSNQQITSSHSVQINEESAFTVLARREQLESYIVKGGNPFHRPENTIYNPSDRHELLQHFVEVTIPWIGMPQYQRTLQQHGIKLCRNAPYLLYAILAFSASHLSFLHPDQRKYDDAFTSNYSLSLSSYSAQLHIPFDAEEADALIPCGHLHSMLAFRNVHFEDDPESTEGFTWLRAMRGGRILWNTDTGRYHLQGDFWRKAEHNSGDLEEVPCDFTESDAMDSSASKPCMALHRFFTEQSERTTYENLYKRPLSRLCQLMRSHAGHDTICMFMAFVGDLPESFLQLLGGSDLRAMLIMCYWSALLCDIDQWWVTDSAKKVCRTFCTKLDRIADQVVYDLLRFPASKCGYRAAR